MARFFKSPDEVRKQLGLRCKALRKYRRVTQQELANLADVSARSLRRFENTGHGAVDLVVRVAFVLACEELLEPLFTLPEIKTLDEFSERATTP